MSRYDKPESGQWVQPVRRGYKLACCDCGLVHRVNRKQNSRGHTLVQMFRDERATSARRRSRKLRYAIRKLAIRLGD